MISTNLITNWSWVCNNNNKNKLKKVLHHKYKPNNLIYYRILTLYNPTSLPIKVALSLIAVIFYEMDSSIAK